jgi:hypothetical protein
MIGVRKILLRVGKVLLVQTLSPGRNEQFLGQRLFFRLQVLPPHDLTNALFQPRDTAVPNLTEQPVQLTETIPALLRPQLLKVRDSLRVLAVAVMTLRQEQQRDTQAGMDS